ncbi:class I SAM-dependent methyltransferase [Rhizobium sp. A22-96]
MRNFDDFFKECERAPRLNELRQFFSDTAGGNSGVPSQRPKLDRRLLPASGPFSQFSILHQARQGDFDQHYFTNIPYRLEEECRIGCAILNFARKRTGVLKVYSLGTAEGTMARTISELAIGRVETLSCSPDRENFHSFYAYGVPPYASFFHGPFHKLTRELLQTDPRYKPFTDGFDIILEDTTFQMYSPNRREQVRFVKQNLRPRGIFLFVEKFRHEDEEEYRRREHQKDHGFKARYFSSDDIHTKRQMLQRGMEKNLLTLADFASAVRVHFKHCFITWNSGNFYTLAASNSGISLQRFMGELCPPSIPAEYVYLKLPCRLWGSS